MSEDDIKVVFTGEMGQAELIKSVLESENIECYYAADDIGGIIPNLMKSILVNQKDYAKALKILKSIEKEDNGIDQKLNENIKDEEQTNNSKQKPFKISLVLYIVLYCITFGLFHYYWFFKHWSFLKSNDKNNSYIPAVYASVFFPIFNFMLFHRYLKFLNKEGTTFDFLSIFLPLLVLTIASLTKYLPREFFFIWLFSVFCYLPLQFLINESEKK